MKLNARLREIRISKNFSIAEMSEALNVSQDTYISVEMKQIAVNSEMLRSLLASFPELDIEELLTVFEFDSRNMENVLRDEFNKLSAHYFSMSSNVEKYALFAMWLKEEMQLSDADFKAYIPYLKHLKSIPLDILAEITKSENRIHLESVRLLLRSRSDEID